MSHHFSPDELHTLREHGIAIFAGRVLFNVQPPLSEARMAEIEADCAGPLPQALRELWRQTAGGELAYDMRGKMNGNEEALSWSELFYDGSEHYRDLQGWIEHEQELAEEAAEESGHDWDGKLRYLPIGGFEYCDRIYVTVGPGPEAGSVVAWKQGLPGWTHALQEDGIVTIAPDLHAAFGELFLETDPEQDTEYNAGTPLLEYLDERVEDHGLPQALADKVTAFQRQAVLDWQGPLAAGTLGASPRLAQAALRHAVHHDDADMVRRIAAQGMDLKQPLLGGAAPVEAAVGQYAFAAALALLRAGGTCEADILHLVDRAPPVELVEQLLARGAVADAQGIARCAACGAHEAARLVANAADSAALAEYAAVRDEMLKRYQEELRKVRSGKMSHYLGEDGLAERVANLKSFTP